MLIKNLIKGRYYRAKEDNNKDCYWIILYDKTVNGLIYSSNCMTSQSDYYGYSKGGWAFENSVMEIKEASKYEINWLKACIHANKYIPRIVQIHDLIQE